MDVRECADIVSRGALEAIELSMKAKQNPSVSETSEAVMQYGAMRALGNWFMAVDKQARPRVFDELPFGSIKNFPQGARRLCRTASHPFDLVVCYPMSDAASRAELDDDVPALGIIEVKKFAGDLLGTGGAAAQSDAGILAAVVSHARSSEPRSISWALLVGLINGPTASSVHDRHGALVKRMSEHEFVPLRECGPIDPRSAWADELPIGNVGDPWFHVAVFGRTTR